MILLLIGLGFLLYFYWYIPKNEAVLDQKAFRVINSFKDRFSKTIMEESRRIDIRIESRIRSGRTRIQGLIKADASILSGEKVKLMDKVYLQAASNLKSRSNIIFESGKFRKYRSREEISYIYYQSLEKYIRSIIVGKYFSSILIFDENRIIYNSDSSLPVNSIPDSIISSKNDEPSGAFKAELLSMNTRFYIYVVPMQISNGQKLYVAGIYPRGEFASAARKVNHFFILGLGLLILLAVVFMPLIKLKIMSQFEKMDNIDIYAAAFSLFVGVSLVMLLILSFFNYETKKKSHAKNLIQFNEEIIDNFRFELDEALSFLDKAEQFLLAFQKSELGSDTIIGNLNYKQIILLNDFGKGHVINSEIPGGIKKLGNHIYGRKFAIDRKVFTDSFTYNLSERRYFTDLRDQKSWQFRVHNNGSNEAGNLVKHDYVFQTLSSYKDNSKEVVVTKKTTRAWDQTWGLQTPTAFGLSLDFVSLKKPILPPGYSYCIVDHNGEVHFHSDEHKILYENFIRENSKTSFIEEVLGSRACIELESEYELRDYQMYFCPIPNTPFTTVTMFEKEVQGIANYNAAYFTFLVISIIILFLFAISVLVKFIAYRNGLLEKTVFSYKWLAFRPKMFLGYFKLLLVAILLVTYLIAGLLLEPNMEFKYLLRLLNVIAALSFSNSLLLNYQALKDDKKLTFFIIIHGAIQSGLLFVQLWLYPGFNFGFLGILSIVCLILFFPHEILYRNIQLFSKHRKNREQNLQLYYSFLFLNLIAITILPTYLAFQSAENIEQITYDKNMQFQQVERIKERVRIDKTSGIRRDLDAYLSTRAGNYLMQTTGTSQKQISREKLHEHIDHHQSNRDGQTESSRFLLEAYTFLKPQFDYGKPRFQSGLVLSESIDDLHWWSLTEDTLSLWSEIADPTSGGQDQSFFLRTTSSLSGQIKENTILRLLILAALALTLYYLLQSLLGYLLKKAFHINLLFKIKQHFPYQRTNTDTNLFLIGYEQFAMVEFARESFFSGELENAKEEEKKMKMDAMTQNIDCIHYNFSDFSYDKNKELFILSHFEHRLFDLKTLHEVLDAIDELLSLRKHIVICSGASFEFVFDQFDKNSILGQTFLDKQEQVLLGNRWKSTFRKFNRIILPLSASDLDHVEDQVRIETEHGSYLRKLADKIDLKCFGQSPTERVNMILGIQDTAESYYYYLWMCCTSLEKLLLFDLAQDGIINTKNTSVVRQLAQKGLIRLENGVELINESFRNFILSSYAEEEVSTISPLINKRGSWSRYRGIILLVLISGFIFIMLSGEFFNKMLTFLTAGAALVPLLVRIGQGLMLTGIGKEKSK